MKQNNIKNIYRGDIIWVDLGEFPGSHRQSGKRPCLVVSTDKGNGPVYTVMPGTSKQEKKAFPVHVTVFQKDVFGRLGKTTVFMAEQLVTIDDRQILMKAGHIPENLLDYEETPGASEVINKWVDEGHEVFVVTGRPFDSYEPSRRWLDEHHLNRLPIYFVDKYGREMFKQDHTYNLTLEELYCMHFDFAIEDSPAAFEHVQHFKDCKVAVYDRPWNKQVEFPDESFVRCLDWKEIDRLWQQQVAFQTADLSI